MALVETPYYLAYTKNDIRFGFLLTDLERPGLTLQMRLFYQYFGASGMNTLYTFDNLRPDADGYIYIYVQAYLNSVLEYVTPDPTSVHIHAAKQYCKYGLAFREITDADPDPVWVFPGEMQLVAFKGGVEQHKSSRNNIFVHHIEDNRAFLTWQPEKRFVCIDEPTHITFINYTAITIPESGFIVNITVTYSDGTTESISPVFDESFGIVYHLNINCSGWGFTPPEGQKIIYMDVSVTSADAETDLALPYRFYIDYRPVYDSYDLVWHNSLSGVDSLRIGGDTNTAFDRTNTEIEGGFNLGEWNANPKTPQHSYGAVFLQRKFKINTGTGRTRTRRQQEALMEILSSKAVYVKTGLWYSPVKVTQSSYDLGNIKDLSNGFDIEFEMAEINEVFTPFDRSFGFGTD